MKKNLPLKDWQKVYDMRIVLDLGSGTTRLKVLGEKEEQILPTLVALAEDNKTILGIGEEAQELMGKVGSHMKIARPVRQGVLQEIHSTTVLLRYLFQHHLKYSWLFKPIILASVAADATTVEREAVRDVLYLAGAKKVYVVDQPLASAIGAGLPVAQSSGNVIIQIGAGITELAVISLGTIIASKSVRWGGERLDELILKKIRQEAQIEVSATTAEFLKKNLTMVETKGQSDMLSIKGRHIVTGTPTEATMRTSELLIAIQPALEELMTLIKEFLEDIPTEVATDVIDKGIILSGGGSQLTGLVPLLTQTLEIPVALAEQPEDGVLAGLQVIGQHLEMYERSLGFNE